MAAQYIVDLGYAHGVAGKVERVGDPICEHGEWVEAPPLVLRLRACRSAAGWYAGYFCPECGPFSRCTDYMRTREDAEAFVAMIGDD